jgi:hypothetical protein
MLSRDDIRNRAAKQFAVQPQEALLANTALTEIFAALDRLRGIGLTYSLTPELVSNYMPVEWPKWVDGRLWDSQAHMEADVPKVLLAPSVPALAGNIAVESKVPFHAIVIEDKDETTLPPTLPTWVIVSSIDKNLLLSDAQALALYKAGGKHFGKFTTQLAADAYLTWLETTPQREAQAELEAKDFDEAPKGASISDQKAKADAAEMARLKAAQKAPAVLGAAP